MRHATTGLLSILLIFFNVVSTNAADAEQKELVPVRVQLKWYHQYQFAGLYAAIEQGYFREAGLDVSLIEGGPTIDPVHAVIKGGAEFGIGNSSLLIDYSNGTPVVAISAIYQHSPFAIIARRDGDIKTVHDLEGKVLMSETHAAELSAYLKLSGVRLDKVKIVPHTGSIINIGKNDPSGIDAATAYLSVENYEASKLKIPYIIFNPRDLKINFYGDTLFTSKDYATKQNQIVISMRDALRRGWEYARLHHDEVIDLILQKYSPRSDRLALSFEAQSTNTLLGEDIIDIGYMSKSRWQHIGDTFAKAGMLKPDFTLDGFMFDAEENIPLWLYQWLAGFLLLLTVSVFVAQRYYRMSNRLKQEVVFGESLQRKLEAEVETKNRIFSIIAHDLRSPFQAIFWSTELISKHPEKFSKEEMVEFAGDANKAGKQVFSLLENLLEWARLHADKGGPEPERFAVRNVSEECRSLLTSVAEAKDIQIKNNVEEFDAFADKRAVMTVIRNLLANSIKFTPHNGSIEMSTTKRGHDIQFTIRDTGVGMSEEQINVVFEFGQNTSTQGTSGEMGTGLGLPLCKELIENNGGQFWIESTPGEGSRFHFTLPVGAGKA